MYPQQPPKISTQGAFPSFQGQQIWRDMSQQGRSTAWARSQSHCPMRSCCCPGTSPWSLFLDCLSIFVVITFILTFQSIFHFSKSKGWFNSYFVWRQLCFSTLHEISNSLIHPVFSFTLSLQLCKVQSFIIHSPESFWNIKQNVKFKGRENKAPEILWEKQYFLSNPPSSNHEPQWALNSGGH